MTQIQPNDFALLKSLADYRALTAQQVTALHFSGKKVARRRLRQLQKEGLVKTTHRGLGRSKGRPEIVFFLSEDGVNLLEKSGILPNSFSAKHADANQIRCLDHQLLVNWFRIHLIQIEKIIPQLKIDFLSPETLIQTKQAKVLSAPSPETTISRPEGIKIGFAPDGMFVVNDTEQQKTVLFFLEVDMGTESLASPKRSSTDVRQKIINHKSCFRQKRYQSFERIWECNLKGFRLLFLCNSPERLIAVCRLVQEMPPSDFIWVTEQAHMFEKGLAEAIWARGGKQERNFESILNWDLCRPSPVLPLNP